MRLKIVAPTGRGLGTAVYLDGKQLTGVIGTSVEIDIEGLSRATITFHPSEIDIEGDFAVERKSAVLPKEVPHA